MARARADISILRVFTSWRMAIVMVMGFASGLPLALTGTTLQVWMGSEHVDLTVIGIFGAVALPYTLKFAWSPLMDRFTPPFLGRRRGWMLLCQIALIASLVALAFSSVHRPWIIAGLALAVAFFSASQDIVIDAYRTEILKPEELGAGASLYIAGYRVGLICSSALALRLAGHHSWQSVYLVMAGAMFIGVLATLLAPEPRVGGTPPRTMAEAVVLPLTEFLRRRGAIEMLLFILIYKLDWAMVYAMSSLFLVSAGFEKEVIGDATGLGILATIGGAIIGGTAMTRVGIHRSLWIFGLLQGLAGISFTLLALMGKNYAMMVTAVLVENVCSGMATAAFAGFIMSLCDKRFTATQFALLTSLMALCRVLAGVPAGWLAKNIGWPGYFVVATLIAIPGLLLLLRYRHWQGATLEAKSAPQV